MCLQRRVSYERGVERDCCEGWPLLRIVPYFLLGARVSGEFLGRRLCYSMYMEVIFIFLLRFVDIFGSICTRVP